MSDAGIFGQVGWICLHFLWQGPAVLVLLVVMLRLLPSNRAALRYGVSWFALLSLAALPVATFIWYDAVPRWPALDEVAHLVGVFWCAVVPLRICFLVTQLIHLEFLRTAGTGRVAPEREARLQQLAHRVGLIVPVRFLVSSRLSTPATIGFLRPVVLIPPETDALDTAEFEAIMLHELAHVKRGDWLIRVFQSAIEVFLFFQPALSKISAEIDAEREDCCDDRAAEFCGNRRLYAEALVHLEEAAVGQLGIAESPLARRVKRLMGFTTRYRLSSNNMPLLSSFLWLSLLLAVVAGGWLHMEAFATPSAATQPAVLVALDTPTWEYDGPREMVLPAYGRAAFRTEMHPDRRWSHSYRVKPRLPGSICIQIASESPELFRPFLTTTWPCPYYAQDHVDGDLLGGRGARPFHQIVLDHPEYVQFDIHCKHELEGPAIGRDPVYCIATVWQPRAHNDMDPDVIGPESTPVLLDANGSGRAYLRPGENAPPTLDFPSDIDTFQVQARAAAPLTILVDATKGALTPFVRVYDSEGHQFAQSPASNGTAARVTLQPRQAGERYYFAVTALDALSTGIYEVRVSNR